MGQVYSVAENELKGPAKLGTTGQALGLSLWQLVAALRCIEVATNTFKMRRMPLLFQTMHEQN